MIGCLLVADAPTTDDPDAIRAMEDFLNAQESKVIAEARLREARRRFMSAAIHLSGEMIRIKAEHVGGVGWPLLNEYKRKRNSDPGQPSPEAAAALQKAVSRGNELLGRDDPSRTGF